MGGRGEPGVAGVADVAHGEGPAVPGDHVDVVAFSGPGVGQ